MENYKLLKILIGIYFSALPLCPVFAYESKTTHPALTQEILKQTTSHQFTDREKELTIKGSVDEDASVRPFNHFYDPLYNRGLVSLLAGGSWKSAVVWAEDPIEQAAHDPQYFVANIGGLFRPLFGASTDYSWQRGIYEYAWGDKVRGIESLGHILHLIEDMSVPEHTRNDPHPPMFHQGSPYEAWTDGITRANIKVDMSRQDIPSLPLLSDYFKRLALYSNRNFFSRHTTNSPEYSSPSVSAIRAEKVHSKTYLYAMSHLEGRDYHLARIEKEISNLHKMRMVLDQDPVIMRDYWDLLSKQAVISGAGVVKLFFSEVEKEKSTRSLYQKNQSWFERKIDETKRMLFVLTSALYGSSVTLSDLEHNLPVEKTTPINIKTIEETKNGNMPKKNVIIVVPKTKEPERMNVKTGGDTPTAPEYPHPSPATSSETAYITIANSHIQFPVFIGSFIGGGGGTTPEPEKKSSSPQLLPPTPSSSLVTDTSTPLTASSSIAHFFSTHSTSTVATSSSEKIASSSPSEPNSMLPFPATDISVGGCEANTGIDQCLVLKTSLHIYWTISSGNIDHYAIHCNTGGNPCENFTFDPKATSTVFNAHDDASYTFTIQAIDTAGNQSVAATKTVYVSTRPVVINEIAWAGISAEHPGSEWIELASRVPVPISLSHWVLYSQSDLKPYLHLSGTIQARGYYLIERGTKDSLNVPADFFASFGSGPGEGLLNSGEVLTLSYASTTVDQTPAPFLCNGWCGGNADSYQTMERYDIDAGGTSTLNWGSNNTFITNGKSKNGLPILGTPKARNSLNYTITHSSSPTLTTSKTLTFAESPYFAHQMVVVPTGLTLKIEPGVVIKFSSGGLQVNGALIAGGTNEKPITFTSFLDDSMAGDTNGDGTTTMPSYGSWSSISLAGAGSLLDHIIIRYGGAFQDNTPRWARAALFVDSVSPPIKNSIIEWSNNVGVALHNSDTILENSVVRNTNHEFLPGGDPMGIKITGNGKPTITHSAIQGNYAGLSIEDGAATILDTTFKENANVAVRLSNNAAASIFTGNTATGNKINAISLMGTLTSSAKLSANLPYTGSYFVSGGRLTIPAGTVCKNLIVNATGSGSLDIHGTPSNPVVFTSLKDDSHGGDTDNNGDFSQVCKNDPTDNHCPLPGSWGHIGISGSGTSTIVSALVRYGGTQPFGAIDISGGHAEIASTTIEYSQPYGVKVSSNGTVHVVESLIQYTKNLLGEAYGFYGSESIVEMASTLFLNNQGGMAIPSGTFINHGSIDVGSSNQIKTTPVNLLSP